MKISKYVYIANDRDKTFIYNTLNKSILEIEGSISLKELSNINMDNGFNKVLVEYEILVDDDLNEFQKAIERFKTCSKSKGKLSITLTTTTRCNCDCFYCYQKGSINQEGDFKYFSEFDHFLKTYQEKYADHTLEISFHGGEPLLCWNWFKKIFNIAKKYFSEVYTTIVTNGTLMNKEIADLLKSINLKKALITIDGPQKIHDQRRPFKFQNGCSPYDKIKNGLKVLLEAGIKVGISINCDQNNINYLPEWYHHEIAPILEKYPQTSFYISRVTSGKNNPLKNIIPTEVFTKKRDSFLKSIGHQFHNSVAFLDDLQDHLCSLKTDHELIFDVTGYIYKCISLVGNVKYSIGHISDPDVVKKNHLYFENFLNESCKICKYFPICYGGCLLERINGDSSKGCRKKSLEQNLKSKIQMYARMREEANDSCE